MPERQQDVLAVELREGERNSEDERGPQADAQRAAHHARLARAVSLRRERRDGRDKAHAEHEADEQHDMRERGRGDHVIAKPADQREIGGHHRDLAELRERDRQREPDGLDKLDAPGRRCGWRRGGVDRLRGVHGGHGQSREKSRCVYAPPARVWIWNGYVTYLTRELRKDDGMTQSKR